ncbi:nuclear factor related to kappa-B-binding protein isoform X1 [Boleophthalmus pectinirostris]|uniref:nuclear factor related to kappa-B-binding protein isoform X1 n=1 Tax=Boleophthalmus pectinirostris TaxID=150288 RepID=UPI000A1C1CC0|nr:nuclear factor related to kappa-B-binding protein isoform X1 [Boleophthalmus pectinirostris]XP_020778599.1 nuclear factor related to kappa-B-binding protein isoform X1 [Boleophthalmus pectinirostris]
MDPITHMLTDPLDPKEGNSGHITEECLLGNCRVSLPEDLLEDPDIFFSVLSGSTWTEVLSDAQRQHLRQFLPQFPDQNISEQDRTISDLFSDRNFHFGNPLHLAQKLFRDGYFNPEVVKYRQLCAKSQRKRQLYSLQQYYHKLLKQILVSRKELLDYAVHNGQDYPPRRKALSKSHAEMREPRVRRRLNRILKEVKAECGDSNASSSDDELSMWTSAPQSPSSPTPTISLRVLPSLSTQDMKTTEKLELGEQDLKRILHSHREKRKRQPDHPDLVTSDVHLGDILSRANMGRKGPIPLFELSLPKKKIKEERRRKKVRPIKVECEDPGEALGSDANSAPPVNMINSLPDTPSSPLANIKEEMVDESQISPVVVEEIAISFFSLLESILRTEALTTSGIEEKIQLWQSSPASSLNAWFSSACCWSDLVLQALQFLAGETKDGRMALPSGFLPFVEFSDETQQWRWIGPTQDTEKDLSALCQLWLDSKDLVIKTENEEMLEMISPTPRVSTDYVVRPSTGDEKQLFQIQEQQRYNQPHKAFTFRMHGFESVVGPVKGVFDKEMSLNKAREHTLLRSDRPPYVTILSLVRDAAARLPNGEGTRAEICELLKDSQFLAPEVTSAQVNTVVSGALDRLHYEKDPCVKYDIGRKLWIYLHRSRSQEEFERIHQAQAAAAKARKALQQKPKPAPKAKSGSKEGASKLGCLEGDIVPTPMSPIATTPNTPGTPMSPLPSTVTTPTKSAVPDTIKTSPGVLLVSPPPLPQLGTILPTSQAAPPPSQTVSSQHAARLVSHLAAGTLPQVRVVSAQPGLAAAPGGHQATIMHQPTHQIRMPVSVATKGISQAVVSVPLRSQPSSNPVQVPPTLSVSTVTVTKPQTGSPGSPSNAPSSPAVLQGVSSPNIKQVSITGQLGVKTTCGGGIPITATNLRIQGKDVLRLPPSSITTDAKGQTVLRITPDMMATLTKSPVATVKLTPEFLGQAAAAGSKSISATLHVTPTHPSPTTASSSASSSGEVPTSNASPGTALLKATGDTAIRLMPTLAVSVADQKARTFTTVSSPEKSSATIRIMPGLGVIPPKPAQTITMAPSTGSKPPAVSSVASVVTMAANVVAGAKGLTVASAASGSPITLGTATATVRQVPATVVSTQTGKLPARITVPLSVLNQPLKSKSVVTTPIVKGNLNTNISGLGRNIILTTMPAGTKLIAGNKPVSFVTAQQFQQLQQQGQATQVRIQTVPAQQLQQHMASAGSPKAVSTVVVTAPSPSRPPDPPPAPPQ